MSDSKANVKDNKKSQRPLDIAFIQQKLPAYYPVLNAGLIYPVFLIISLLFIPIGIGIFYYAEGIQEETIDYTNCTSLENPRRTCADILNATLFNNRNEWNQINPSCSCKVDFILPKMQAKEVYMYYALTNYYQNHLKYYTSRDENQLKGDIGTISKNISDNKRPSTNCKPYAFDEANQCKPIFPCGVQANSMFFDVFKLSHWHKDQDNFIPMRNTGITRASDEKKFQNPEQLKNIKDPIWSVFGKPPAWKKNIWELDNDIENNGVKNEDFIVWMRTAAFPNFRKLHRIIDTSNELDEDGLPAGNYSLHVNYNIDVSRFEGSKSIILTTSRMTAAKNYFLASAFFITGIIMLILFIAFLIIHMFTKNRHTQFKMD